MSGLDKEKARDLSMDFFAFVALRHSRKAAKLEVFPSQSRQNWYRE